MIVKWLVAVEGDVLLNFDSADRTTGNVPTPDKLLTLADAAAQLGVVPVTLRAAIARGRLGARKFGTTWVTTTEEVAWYASNSLGRRGRPRRSAGAP